MPPFPSAAPPASGVRTPWERLPVHVRDGVAEILGAPVATATTQRGGFSPGLAARVGTADGRRAFVKAVSAEAGPLGPGLHRTEARHTAALPPDTPAPRLLGTYDDGVWVALVFEDIPGIQPHVPWRDDELGRVLTAVHGLSDRLTPSPFDAPSVTDRHRDTFRGWEHLMAAGGTHGLDPWAAHHLPQLARLSEDWAEHAAGHTLTHGDLRADNVLLTADDRVVFVDWPHACVAAPWFDLLLMLPCVRAQGGPDPQRVFTEHPLGRDADPEGVTSVLAALAGRFVHLSRRPPPAGRPTVRAFQHAQGVAALRWLRSRLAKRPVRGLA
ncbi:aminoglycoside phosphotransferase family protein [Streptomyces sp. NPDC058045]|uniref:aminoglycoside phosphotransferase family protein n=1 Tax=Streptomyces sp. NPDC058045 TaxID=3346311 RepID=UPI0036EDD542